jgi:hypothetical protein
VHDTISAQSVATKPIEFTGMGAETLKLELLFDAYEANDGTSVVQAIAKIKRMASVRDPARDTDEEFGRPHYCTVTWGKRQPRFDCIIESVSVRYQVFASDGTPLRATVTVGLKSGRRPINDAERDESRLVRQGRLDKEYNARADRQKAVEATAKRRAGGAG